MANRISNIPKGSGRGLLVLAVLFAALAAVLAFVALSRSGDSKDEAAAAETKTVVVAGRDIPARTELKSDMLKTAKVPVGVGVADRDDAGPRLETAIDELLHVALALAADADAAELDDVARGGPGEDG